MGPLRIANALGELSLRSYHRRHRKFLEAPQVELARAQIRQRIHVHELIGSRLPQCRQI